MTRNTFLLSLMLLLLLPATNYPQSLSIGFGASLLSVQSPSFYADGIGLPGYYIVNGIQGSEYNGLNLGREFQLNSLVGYRLQGLPIGLALQVNYTFLRGHGDSYFWDDMIRQNIPTKVTTQLDLLTVALAANCYIIRGDLSPFVTLSAQLNDFSDTRLRHEYSDILVESKNNGGGTRFGLGWGAGTDIRILSRLSLRAFGSYDIQNLGGRNLGEGLMRSLSLGAIFLYNVLN